MAEKPFALRLRILRHSDLRREPEQGVIDDPHTFSAYRLFVITFIMSPKNCALPFLHHRGEPSSNDKNTRSAVGLHQTAPETSQGKKTYV